MERIETTINKRYKRNKNKIMNLNIDGSGENHINTGVGFFDICLLTFQSMGLWI